MQTKKFLKENLSILATVGMMLVMGSAVLLTACQPKVYPTSAGVATATPVPISSGSGCGTGTTNTNGTVSNTSAGLVAFTGFLCNGNTQFSFVTTTALSAGAVIYFTTYTYDPTVSGGIAPFVDNSTTSSSSSTWPNNCGSSISWQANQATTITAGTISYTATSGLPADTQVVIGNSGTNVLQGGAVANVAGNAAKTYLVLNHNGAGSHILAYMINAGPVTTFVGGIMFGHNSWYQNTAGYASGTTTIPAGNFWDSYLPTNSATGLNSSTSTDLSSNWASAGLDNDNNSTIQNDNAALVNGSCSTLSLSGLISATWTVDGNQAKTAVDLSPVVGLTGSCTQGGYQGTLP